MRRVIPQLTILAVAFAALALTGCGGGGADAEEMAGSGTDTGSEFTEETLGMEDQPTITTVEGLQTVYFDFDRYNIRDDQKPELRENAEAIIANPDWGTIVLEGHADERGSDEYNLALGERRASSVRRYLVDLGVPSTRVTTVSYGEAKPAVQGHDESAWRWNRRVEFRASRG